MRTAIAMASVSLLFFLSPAQAEEATGRVRAIYYEAARGVLVEGSMLRKPGSVRWVEVELQDALPEKRRRALVHLPAELHAGVGDLVTVQTGDPKAAGLARELPVLAVDRVTGVLRSSQIAAPGR